MTNTMTRPNHGGGFAKFCDAFDQGGTATDCLLPTIMSWNTMRQNELHSSVDDIETFSFLTNWFNFVYTFYTVPPHRTMCTV